MKRTAKTLLSIGLAGAFTAVSLSPSAATPPSGAANLLLARGTNTSHGTIPLQVGTDVAMARVTINPGGSSGWHSHPGGAIVVVKEGAVTVYSSVGGRCQTATYSAGQAFIERPREVGDVRNTGTVAYVAYATFPRVPEGGAMRIDEPDPGTCLGI